MHSNITQHFPRMEDLLARCDDWVEQSQRWNRSVCSDFLTRSEQECVSRYFGNQYEYRFIPETEGCDRKCVLMGDDTEQPVVLLHGTYSNRFLKLTHRDLKGALLQSGIKEDQFGDLWVEDGHLYVYVKRQIKDAVIYGVNKVHRANIRFEEIGFCTPAVRTKELTVNVSSERIDQFVSELANVSRAKAQSYIRSQFVKRNDNELVKCDELCHNGDTVSIRHVGKFRIGEKITITKRGNLVIRVYQYL